jgi:hypothetical protein
MSAAIETWMRGRMGLDMGGEKEIIKTKEGVVKKIAEDMITYFKEDKKDSAIKDQLVYTAKGLQFIFLNDFAKKISIDRAEKLLEKELKKRGLKVGN